MEGAHHDSRRLREDVECAMRRALDPGEVLPLLHRLVKAAPPASEESVFAHRQMAELLVERHPWRASLYARKVLSWSDDDERAWAILGLCQTLLGHYQYAAKAYRRAHVISPENPWYAHNLGHLLDVALGRPREAITFLRAAHQRAQSHKEIIASYAHALARAGELETAKQVLVPVMRKGSSREHAALAKWIEQGAPADQDLGQASYEAQLPDRAAVVRPIRPGRGRKSGKDETARMLTSSLEVALAHGLECLPLSGPTRARARAAARDVKVRALLGEGHPPAGLAAAIAYAVVRNEGVPLTQAEVAATFRVSAASLRGRYGALCAVAPLLLKRR